MKNRFFALWISAICIIVFILQLLFAGFTDLFVLNSSAYYEVWRFVTSIFLHADVMHIAYNLFALILFGMVLESLIGSKRFLLVFLISGILANIISVSFYDSSLGASGAIFSVIGALIIVRPSLTVWAFGLPMPIFIAGILWAGVDILGVISPSNVANIAHLSGMFFGLIIGLLFRDWKAKRNADNQYNINEREIRNWEDNFMR
jgi:membrane associated rhomboid family serine protease